jgi:kanosamine 6-kinase
LSAWRWVIFLGIDIGGTKVAFRAESDGEGARELTFTWPNSKGVSGDLEQLRRHADQIREDCPEEIIAVGVASPATLDAAGHVVSWPSRPAWVGLDLAAQLGELFPGAELRCADDGDLAAVAEARHAACDDVLYVGVGTGIGGGIVLGGRCCPGLERGSCELGHMVVNRRGERCDCGRQGCVQAEASGPAILRRAAQVRGKVVDFAELRQAFAARASWATKTVEHGCGALAAALVSVAELVRPSLILIGGGFAAGIPGLVETVAEQAESMARPGHPLPVIRPAVLGGLSSLHGAVLAARGQT